MKIRTRLIPAAAVLLMSVLACTASSTISSPTAPPLPSPTTAAVASSNAPAQAAPPATILKPGEYRQKISAGGVVRPYLLHIPPGYDGSSAVPLVFVLHGYGGNAGGMARSTGLDDKADHENFLVAYLNGTGDPPGWNSGLTPDLGLMVDDVDFVRTLLSDLQKLIYVDNLRVYATGFSNGAFMTHRLGAELSDVLAGIGVVEGTIGIRQADGTVATTPDPVGPIPVIIINGKKDPNVLYDGGKGGPDGRLDALPVADAVAFWTKADGCTGAPHTEALPNGNVTEDYQTCTAGSEVLLYTTANGVHQWATAEGPAKLSATDAIWEFFRRHHK